MRGNSHVRFGAGEKVEIISKPYLSPSAAYAVIGYQTAWLMRYYPVEFIAAMLNSFIGSAEKARFYIRYAETLGIELLAPDINESGSRFTVSGNKIRFGLGGIKNLGFGVIDTIIQAREEKGAFTSFPDFMGKLEEANLNKRASECLIKAGAFDSLGVPRSQLLAVYERIMDSFSAERRRNIKGQLSFFGGEAGDGTQDSDGFAIPYPEIEEFPLRDRLFMEKEMTGLYLSGHPLDEYKEELEAICTLQIQEIIDSDLLDDVRDEAALEAESQMTDQASLYDGQKVTLCGILTGISRKITRNNAMMAFAVLEDLTGEAEIIVFPKTFEQVKERLQEDLVVAVSGRLQIREDENTKIIVEEMSPIEKGALPQFRTAMPRTVAPAGAAAPNNGGRKASQREEKPQAPQAKEGSKLFLRFHDLAEAKAILGALRPLLAVYRGQTPVMVFTADDRKTFLLPKNQWIDADGPIISLLKRKLGEANVVLKTE